MRSTSDPESVALRIAVDGRVELTPVRPGRALDDLRAGLGCTTVGELDLNDSYDMWYDDNPPAGLCNLRAVLLTRVFKRHFPFGPYLGLGPVIVTRIEAGDAVPLTSEDISLMQSLLALFCDPSDDDDEYDEFR